MSDPNAASWTEHRSFTAKVGDLSLFVWKQDGRFLWDVRVATQAGRGGDSASFLKAKRAAEACARVWKSEIELAGGVP